MTEFLAARGAEMVLAVVSWLLLSIIRRNQRDVDSAHDKIRNESAARHALELTIARDHPTASDVGDEIRAAIEPFTVRMQSGDNRMQRIESSLDRIENKLDQRIGAR